jgi:hypothetical protein
VYGLQAEDISVPISAYLHHKLHPQLLMMRNFDPIFWLIAGTYPYCTILPFTNLVQHTFSNTLCSVKI